MASSLSCLWHIVWSHHCNYLRCQQLPKVQLAMSDQHQPLQEHSRLYLYHRGCDMDRDGWLPQGLSHSDGTLSGGRRCCCALVLLWSRRENFETYAKDEQMVRLGCCKCSTGELMSIFHGFCFTCLKWSCEPVERP